MKMRVEFIRWNDSAGAHGPVEPNEIGDDFFIHTAGVFVKETPHTVVVAQDLFMDSGRVRDHEVVRKVNIISRKAFYLEVDEMPHKSKAKAYPATKGHPGKKKTKRK